MAVGKFAFDEEAYAKILPIAAAEYRKFLNNGFGGRFIGFGSKRFNPGDVSGKEGEDWNPTIPDRERTSERNGGR